MECLRTKGRVYFLHGKYPELREAAEQALEVSLALQDRNGEGVSLQQLGTLHYILGEYGEAREYYQRSLAINQEIGDRRGEVDSLNNIGNILLELGDYPESERAYQKGEDLTKEIGAMEVGAYILAGLAALYLQQDRLPLAEEKILRIRNLAGAFNSRELPGMAHCLLGRLLVKRGEGGPTRAAFRESIEIFKEARNELELGKTCYYFAQGLRALGDPSDSEWFWVQAKEIFQHLGAQGWLRKIEAGKEQPGDEV